MGRVDQREGRVAGHEDGVGLVTAVGGHGLGADLVGVHGVPPVLDDLLMARLGDRRRPAVRLEHGVAALVDRQEDVAVVGPGRPPEAEPAVVHRHAADVAPLDLALGLEPLADLDQLVERLRHLVLRDQILAVEEHAHGVDHGNGGELAVVVDEGVERLDGDLVHAGHVVERLDPLLPLLAPVVVVPDDVELGAARGQRGGDLLVEDLVGHGNLDQLDPVRLGPFIHDGDVSLVDVVLHVADLEFLGGRQRARAPDHESGQDHQAGQQPERLRKTSGHVLLPDLWRRGRSPRR